MPTAARNTSPRAIRRGSTCPRAEAATAVARFFKLTERLPGAQGVVYDTALRGVHHQRLIRVLGWVSVNRVTAAAGSRGRGGGKNRRRVEKLVDVETKTVRAPAGRSRCGCLPKVDASA